MDMVLEASQRRYQGSHTAALFVKDDHLAIAPLDIEETNREADSWGAKPGKILQRLIKVFSCSYYNHCHRGKETVYWLSILGESRMV